MAILRIMIQFLDKNSMIRHQLKSKTQKEIESTWKDKLTECATADMMKASSQTSVETEKWLKTIMIWIWKPSLVVRPFKVRCRLKIKSLVSALTVN